MRIVSWQDLPQSPSKILYPLVANGTSPAQVVFSYDSSNSVNERLNRVYYHKLWSGEFLSPDDQSLISYYKYNGTSRVAEVDIHKTGTGRLAQRQMFSSGNDYDAWDRFGRTLEQKREDGATLLDQVDYTYDYAGNRLTRDVNASSNDTRDQKYDYDGLHRLKNVEGGTLSSGSISSRQLEQDWTLDQLGNWSTFKERDTDTGGTWDLDQDRAHNDVNEIDDGTNNGITTTNGPNWANPVHDKAGNMTTIPQPKSPTSSYTLKYDAWNRLVELKDGSTVTTNEYDGLRGKTGTGPVL